MSENIQKRIWKILEVAEDDDRKSERIPTVKLDGKVKSIDGYSKSRIFYASRIFDIFIMSLIVLNVVAVILETVESLSSRYGAFFSTFEVFSVAVFTIEYILRLWACTAETSEEGFWKSLKRRTQYTVTPFALIDLMAILPFYLPMICPVDLRFLRILRLFRFTRLLKMLKYSDSVETLGSVVKAKRQELSIALSVVLILLVFASSLMYFVEHAAQPKAFPNIPAAMWWGVATLTTVGYGDVYPITAIGKSLGAVIAMLGILMIALPTGILSGGFADAIKERSMKILDQKEMVATIQKGNPGTDEIELLIKLSVEEIKTKGKLNVRIK